MPDYDRRYSLTPGSDDEFKLDRQNKWRMEHPGEPLPHRRESDGLAEMAWRMDRLEAGIVKILSVLPDTSLGDEVTEKLGKQLKSQFTIQSEEHYNHHVYIRALKKRDEDGDKRLSDLKMDVAKWIIVALLGAIFISINYSKFFNL